MAHLTSAVETVASPKTDDPFVTVRIDVFVLKPEELEEIAEQAYRAGQLDALAHVNLAAACAPSPLKTQKEK